VYCGWLLRSSRWNVLQVCQLIVENNLNQGDMQDNKMGMHAMALWSGKRFSKFGKVYYT